MTIDHRKEIIKVAARDAWLNPAVDRQVTFRPSQLSPSVGTRRVLRMSFLDVPLPSNDRRYMVYEIGQLSPSFYGLDKRIRSWTKLSDIANDNNMIINGFINFRQILLSTAYMIRTVNNNTLIAIDYDDNKEMLATGRNFYLRFYSNAWFATTEGSASTGCKTNGIRVTDDQSITDFLAEYNTDKALTGDTKLYWNGVYVDGIAASEIKTNDRLEYTHDASGEGYFDISLNDTLHFDSELDAIRKYLVTQPDNGREGFDYYDDVEFFTCSPEEDGTGADRNAGFFLASLQENDIRQITHRDWSLDSLRVQEMFLRQPTRLRYSQGFIRVFLRKTVTPEKLPQDYNLLRSFYLLPYDMRRMMLVGSMSVIDEWKAVNLENSAYMKWLGNNYFDLRHENLPKVFSFYGLNSITERPIYNDDNSRMSVPSILKKGGALIRYDSDGLLVDVNPVTEAEASADDLVVGPGWLGAEVIPGSRITQPNAWDIEVGMTDIDLGEYAAGLYYKAQGGTEWIKAVEGTDFDYVGENTITWKEHHFTSQRYWRDGGRYYLREWTANAGSIIGQSIPIFEGNGPFINKDISYLDVWLGKKRLVRDLDYFVEYPEITIVNREYYSTDDIDMTFIVHGANGADDPVRTGFVEHRLLNYRGRFELDIYRDRPVIVDGRYALPSQLAWSEKRVSGVEVDASFPEGSPYSILQARSRLPTKIVAELADTPDVARQRDTTISDFLTGRLIEDEISDPIVVPNRHAIVSVFMNAIIEAVLDGSISVTHSNYSDMGIRALVAPWVHLVDKDVTQQGFDGEYVLPHASWRNSRTGVSSDQYTFLTRVNNLYLAGRIDLSIYLNIV